jgi:serine/threonine protein kinase
MAGQRVIDEQGVVYRLADCLGQGGQGEVYAVEGGRVAIKRLFVADPQIREHLRRQLARLRRLPLEGLPLARPLSLLRPPEVGYVMERLTGMMPLARLFLQGEQPLQRFLETGGLRRRLRLLVALGSALDSLHERGLAYGDLSPQNIFVSEGVTGNELKLIDLDNLSPMTGTPGRCIFTPFYGAPELVRGEGSSSSLTDVYSFAVICFELLAGVHPLMGDAVCDGEPELETQALEGQLPWIDHPSDAWNQTVRGLPRGLVLSPGLQALAEQNFHPGLLSPEERPSVRDWLERLQAALDATLQCPGCPASYYLREKLCPYCDTPRPELMLVRAEHWSVSMQHARTLEVTAAEHPRPWRRPLAPVKVLEADAITPLTAAFLGEAGGLEGMQEWVSLKFEGSSLHVRACVTEAKDFWLLSDEGQLEPVRTGFRTLRLPQAGDIGWALHAGHPFEPGRMDGHRRIRFLRVPGG